MRNFPWMIFLFLNFFSHINMSESQNVNKWRQFSFILTILLLKPKHYIKWKDNCYFIFLKKDLEYKQKTMSSTKTFFFFYRILLLSDSLIMMRRKKFFLLSSWKNYIFSDDWPLDWDLDQQALMNENMFAHELTEAEVGLSLRQCFLINDDYFLTLCFLLFIR